MQMFFLLLQSKSPIVSSSSTAAALNEAEPRIRTLLDDARADAKGDLLDAGYKMLWRSVLSGAALMLLWKIIPSRKA